MGAIAQDFAAVKAVPQAHGSGWTGLTKRIWMVLYSEGGRWTSAEIADRLRYSGTSIYTTLREMVDRKLVVRIDGDNVHGENVIQYAVTKACKVPRDVGLDEIEELLQLGAVGRPQ